MKREKMKNYIYSVVFVAILTSFLIMFNSGITGRVIEDNTLFLDSGACFDSDGGVNASQPGYLIARSFFRGEQVIVDECTGKKVLIYLQNGTKESVISGIREGYCKNSKKTQVMNSLVLEDGYCVAEDLEINGKNYSVGKWILTEKICLDYSRGVRDEKGKIYRDRCSESEYFTYSCNETSGEVMQFVEECVNGCNSEGCL